MQITEAHASAKDDSDVLARSDSTQGVTLLLTDTAKAAPHLWLLLPESDQDDDREVGHLNLSTKGVGHMDSEVESGNLNPEVINRSFKIPLANTVFQSGNISTFFAQRMEIFKRPDRRVRPICVRDRSLREQTVKLPDFPEAPTLSELSTLLTPITEPRVVQTAVGNILKTLRQDFSSRQPFPASQELEAAVSSWRTQFSSDGQRPGVWALVRPREVVQGLEELVAPLHVLTQIDTGARLHRVLSGGGGWGSKQGLLSLDPKCKTTINGPGSSIPPWMRETEDGFGFETFEQTVKAGDIVTFFIAQAPPPGLSAFQPKPRGSSLAIGVCPAIDDMPSSDDQYPSDDMVSITADHFGVLSSKGIEYTLTAENRNATIESKTQSPRVITWTMLDAPCTVFHQWSTGDASR